MVVWNALICVMQGFGRLSMVAASAAQSAAVVVQAGTKEFSSKAFGTSFVALDITSFDFLERLLSDLVHGLRLLLSCLFPLF